MEYLYIFQSIEIRRQNLYLENLKF